MLCGCFAPYIALSIMSTRHRFLVNLLFCLVFGGIVVALYPSPKVVTNYETYLAQIARQPISEPLETSSDAFVSPKGSAFGADSAGRLHVYLASTPSKNPPETLLIYARATSKVPTRLVVRKGEVGVEFVVESLSPEGNFVIPCGDKAQCRRILASVGEPLPLALQVSHDG